MSSQTSSRHESAHTALNGARSANRAQAGSDYVRAGLTTLRLAAGLYRSRLTQRLDELIGRLQADLAITHGRAANALWGA